MCSEVLLFYPRSTPFYNVVQNSRNSFSLRLVFIIRWRIRRLRLEPCSLLSPTQAAAVELLWAVVASEGYSTSLQRSMTSRSCHIHGKEATLQHWSATRTLQHFNYLGARTLLTRTLQHFICSGARKCRVYRATAMDGISSPALLKRLLWRSGICIQPRSVCCVLCVCMKSFGVEIKVGAWWSCGCYWKTNMKLNHKSIGNILTITPGHTGTRFEKLGYKSHCLGRCPTVH